MTVVIIPTKGSKTAKSRLRNSLGDATTSKLIHIMLESIVKTVKQNGNSVILLTTDPNLSFPNVDIILDQQNGLNKSISNVLRSLNPGTKVAIVMGDIPTISCKTLDKILQSSKNGYSIAKTLDRGTSVLSGQTPFELPLCFGVNSATRFIEAAKQKSIPLNIIESKDASYDIDDIDTLENVLTQFPNSDFAINWKKIK